MATSSASSDLRTKLDRLRGSFRWIVVPLLAVVGAFALAAALIEGPALQPFLYGVF